MRQKRNSSAGQGDTPFYPRIVLKSGAPGVGSPSPKPAPPVNQGVISMSSQPRLPASSQLREIEPLEPLLVNGSQTLRASPFDEQSAVLHYWRILRKRRWYVLVTLAVIFGISVVVGLTSTRIYEASSKLAIYPESTSAVDLKDSENGTSGYDNDLALQTQASILLSDTLAL